jgi:hypothetical protein
MVLSMLDERRQLTFGKLLACILLEEGLMDDRASEIVDHELEDWLNLLLCVSCVVGKSIILFDHVNKLLILFKREQMY